MVAENLSDSSMGELHTTSSMSPPPLQSPAPLSVRSDDQLMILPPHSSLFCTRKQREFTPDSKKDETYWDRRRRNNAAAKRSREKRRLNDMLLEKRVVQLSRENHILRAQVTAVFKSYGIRAETLIDMDQVMATLPTEDQLLNISPLPQTSRPLPSPPPMSATMIALPRPVSPRSPNRLEEMYRHHHGFPGQHPKGPQAPSATSTSMSPTPMRIGSPPEQRSALDFSPREENGAPLNKRPAYMVWDNERQTASSASNVSSSCESSGDDPLNLTTCKSRSRSSSENEANEGEELHYMPHKLRYKYHQHESTEKEDY